jgi:Ca2+-binding RTX toxin-like protein
VSAGGFHTCGVRSNGNLVCWGYNRNNQARPPTCQGRLSTVSGTAGDDNLRGGPGHDVIAGLGGNDTIRAGRGNDLICGGGGDDTIRGGPGSDTVSYSASSWAAVTVDLAKKVATGGLGRDTLASIENVIGTRRADTLRGSAKANILKGAGGDDLLAGRGGRDALQGGGGSDTVAYGSAKKGVRVNLVTGRAKGGHGRDTLNRIENVNGSPKGDVIRGNSQRNILRGARGSDRLLGNAASDILNGGRGFDFALYLGASSGVTVDLVAGTARGGHGNDTLLLIENVVGSSNDDTLEGDRRRNEFRGGRGHDLMEGRGGDDTLLGGRGNDEARGGAGRDTCRAETKTRCEA